MASQSLDEVRCPTCGARQGWAETCRRCKCDLRLLRAATHAYAQHRRACLELLNEGEYEPALRHAQACQTLVPDAVSRQLVALCHLLRQDWALAWNDSKSVLDSENRPTS